MNEWGIPVSKDKIIARRNRLIEYQKVGELRFTPLYEIIDVNILDINYMLHEIDNLQSKIDKAIEFVENFNEPIEFFDTEELLDILKGDKQCQN